MDETGLAGWEESKVVYANLFDRFRRDFNNPKDTVVSYYSKDKQTMYTKSIAVPVRKPPPQDCRKPPPRDCKLYRYVIIPEGFWAGVKDPGTRLLTDEELYDTLKLEHDHRWKHMGYRSEKEPHILLFQFTDPPEEEPPTYKSEEERIAAEEEMNRKKAAIREAERKCKEPYYWYIERENQNRKNLRELLPKSYPTDKRPFRTWDGIGRLVIPYPENPLKTYEEESRDKERRTRLMELYAKRDELIREHQAKQLADPNYQEPLDLTLTLDDDQRGTPRQRNNHVKAWMAERMKRALMDETTQ